MFQAEALDSTNQYDSTSLEFDWADRKIKSFDQLRNVTRIDYDVLGRDTLTVYPDSASSQVRKSYRSDATIPLPNMSDSDLFVTTIRNENGDTASEYRDVRGLVCLQTRFNNNVNVKGKTYSQYDALGNLTTIIKPEGDTVYYVHNSQGWLLEEWGADYDSILYRYNRSGSLTHRQDGLLRSLGNDSVDFWEYRLYDGVKRITETGRLKAVNGDTTERTPIRRYFYDQEKYSQHSAGRLSLFISNQNGDRYAERYDYDGRGRIVKQANYFDATLDSALVYGRYEYFPTGDSFVIAFTYNWSDQVTSVTYPDSMVVTYDYDQRGRLAKVGNGTTGNRYASLTYTKRNELDTMKYYWSPGVVGQTINYSYNTRGWLNKINNGLATGGDLFGEEIAYYNYNASDTVENKNGNIRRTKYVVNGGPTQDFIYFYDDLDRLTVSRVKSGSLYLNDERFWYDANGNRDSVFLGNGGSEKKIRYETTAGTNLLDTLHGADTNGYDYDGNGNLIRDRKKQASFVYDLLNQLDTVRFPFSGDSSHTLTFGYNAGGERVYKKWRYYYVEECEPDTIIIGGDGPQGGEELLLGGESLLSGGGGTQYCTRVDSSLTYYIVSQGKVWAEYFNTNVSNAKFRYIYAGDERIAMRDNSNRLHYYLNDHLGSARVVCDTAGVIKD